MTTETPAQVAETAAIEGALPLNALALIGLFEKPDGSMALIRTSRGEIVEVRAGEQTNGITVNAIASDGLHITDSLGNTKVLTLPGS